MLTPAITQLPLFVGFTMILSRASHSPSVLDSEAFLTLTSLTYPDPTHTLPIVLGLITLANVDSARWFASEAVTQRQAKADEWVAQRRAKGETVLQPGRIIQSSLRSLAVGRIIIAALVPGVGPPSSADPAFTHESCQSIQIFWVTSAAFGLVQSWVLDWWYARRTRRQQ